MIPLTIVSECITEHIRARSERSEGYGTVLIGLLILFTAQLLSEGLIFHFSGHLLLPFIFISGKFPQPYLNPWGNKDRQWQIIPPFAFFPPFFEEIEVALFLTGVLQSLWKKMSEDKPHWQI